MVSLTPPSSTPSTGDSHAIASSGTNPSGSWCGAYTTAAALLAHPMPQRELDLQRPRARTDPPPLVLSHAITDDHQGWSLIARHPRDRIQNEVEALGSVQGAHRQDEALPLHARGPEPLARFLLLPHTADLHTFLCRSRSDLRSRHL